MLIGIDPQTCSLIEENLFLQSAAGEELLVEYPQDGSTGEEVVFLATAARAICRSIPANTSASRPTGTAEHVLHPERERHSGLAAFPY